MPKRCDQHWIKSDHRLEHNVGRCVQNRTHAKVHEPGALIQKCALESQLDFRAASFEQGCPQVTLERLHLQRDCWLGETQSIRRLRNTVGLDYGAESFQLLQSILFISERPH